VIVASQGSLAIINPWFHETFQGMAHKTTSNLYQKQANANIKSSKSIRGKHEIRELAC